MTETRIMLAGGGTGEDSQSLDRIFASWTGRSGRMLYLPIAYPDTAAYTEALAWITSVFRPLGVEQIEMWDSLEEHTAEELENFESVYIGGGNTFLLLTLLKSAGFDRYLPEYAAQGKSLYGSSAGAIVLGRNILTASHIDPNDVAQVDTRGLDLAKGHAIWVHYREEDDPLIFEYIHKYALPVLALSERSGAGIEGDRIIAWGHEPIMRFTHRRKRAIQPGEQV